MISPIALRIRELNDAFRATPMITDWLLSYGVGRRSLDFHSRAINAVRRFRDFNEVDDPRGEHAGGTFALDDDQIVWRFEYANAALTGLSDDPADPIRTRRCVLIRLASEPD